MSLLDTVELQGIRSVGIGPTNVAVIEFLTPLTIICGPNGAGKTTIIEALKYVTTGELPKGSFQAFIHDMRLADRARVDASVKLKFKDIKGRSCVVTRRIMQSKGAKGKVTNKSEESTIAIEKEPGEWKSLSSKVVDCKKEVLNLLGLPAAILEYVVFCHQEESSWPLDEPKKLKERFDEIFQVTGYVKAMEVLKKELKENQQELKITEGRLPLLIRQQEEKNELHNEYINLKGQIAENEEEISFNQTKLKEEIVKKEEKVAELDEAEMSRKKSDMIEAEKQILVDQLRCCTAPDYDGGIEDLKCEIESIVHSEEFEDIERDRKQVEKEMDQLNAEIKEHVAKKENINKTIVHLKSTQMMRDKLVAERRRYMEKCRSKFCLKSKETEVLKELHCLVDKRREDVKTFKDALEEKQAICQQEMDNISKNLAQIMTKLEIKCVECERLEKEISAVQNDLMEATNSSQKLELLQEEISENERILETMWNSNEAENNMENLKKQRDNVAGKIEMLKEECRKREKAEDVENKIKRRNDELIKLEKELNALTDKHQNALSEIFNAEEPEFPLCERLAIRARKIAQSLSASEDELKIHENELSRAQFAVSQFGREMDQLSDQISSYKRKITKVVSHENEVETRLNEVRTLLNKSRQDSGRIDGCSFLYEQWEEEIMTKKCCPLCERSCNGAEDSDVLIEKIKQKKKDLPKEAEKLLRKVKDYEEMQNELMEILPYVAMLKESNSEKEQLQQNLNKAQQKLCDVKEEFTKSKSERDLILQRQDVLRNVQVDASLMDNIWKSMSDAKHEIKLLKAEINADDEEKRPLSELRIEIRNNEELFKDLISKLDMAQAAISRRNKLIDKLNESKECRAALNEKALQLDLTKKMLVKKEQELEDSKEDLRELRIQKPIIEQQLRAKKRGRLTLQENGKSDEARLLHLLRDVEDAAKELERIDEKLGDIADGSDDLRNEEENLAQIDAKINVSNVKMGDLTGQIDRLNSKQERKRRLDDQLRKMELQERIKSLDRSLKETEWHGTPVSELRKELSSLSRKVNDLQLVIENKRGEINEQKKRLVNLEKILQSPEYSRFKEELKKEVIKKCVTTKVVEDLSNYIRVVDESVVKFHAQKMEEINEVLGSLWEQVYHGNDIESIQIKSESAGENEKKKSYNYRVVMCVGNTEIDMPGRCSAGQKMLASILIRIALSDVFCDKCSIIALDEPTTNLDVLKVENLGDMLADIITARCANNTKAFQLIVITHDNRFVEHLRQLCRPEWVYAVSKDNAGLSRVKRHRNLEDATMRNE